MNKKPFLIFWVGQALSALGNAFGQVALPLLVLEATGSVAAMGLVTGVTLVAHILAGFWAGVVVDRVDRRRLMIVCDVGRTIACLLVPLAWWLLGPRIEILYFVTIANSLFGVLFQVAYVTAVANLVLPEELTTANARLHVTWSVSSVVGPMLAGGLSHFTGPAVALGIDGVTFLVSAISIACIRFGTPPVSKKATTDLAEGARFLWRHPVLRSVTFVLIGVYFLTQGNNDLFVYRIRSELGGDDSAVGLLFALASAGSLAGGLLVGKIRARLGFGLCFLGGTILEGCALAAIGLHGTFPFLAGSAAVVAFAATIRAVASMSYRQLATPDRLLGRVTAVFYTAILALGPVGAALFTRAAGSLGTIRVFEALGASAIVIGFAGFLTPARAREPDQAPLPETEASGELATGAAPK